MLYQHHHNQVTQPLLREELLEYGVDISRGTISGLLTVGHELFHAEKDSLLPAAREVSSFLQTDDTTARHCGSPGHTLHIGNDLFATSFATSFATERKSRVNFLKCLLLPHTDYAWGEEAVFYLESFQVPQCLLKKLAAAVDDRLVLATASAWGQQLAEWEITSSEQRRLVTEAALWNSLFTHGLYQDSILISDDAKQFKIVNFLHALCWVHQERHIAGLIPLTTRQRRAHSRIRDAI